MKDFFKFREDLQTNEMYADYKSSPGYNDNDHKQFSHHKGDDKRSVQYRKAEHEVSHKHGSDAHAIGHHKGDTAVEHEKSHRDFSGSSSSDHSHHAVVHHDGTHTNISLPNSKKATAAHVTKQSKKVHPNLAADIAHNHNEINFHESVQIQVREDITKRMHAGVRKAISNHHGVDKDDHKDYHSESEAGGTQHIGHHGGHHIYSHGHYEDLSEPQKYAIHNPKTNKTHHVELPTSKQSHSDVHKACSAAGCGDKAVTTALHKHHHDTFSHGHDWAGHDN